MGVGPGWGGWPGERRFLGSRCRGAAVIPGSETGVSGGVPVGLRRMSRRGFLAIAVECRFLGGRWIESKEPSDSKSGQGIRER